MTALDDVLHPPVEPLRHGRLAVDARHTLHWETCGQADGLPALFLHGGPGGGISPTSRRFFDPARYHVVLFDQRGSGRSTPLGETQDNTTPLLIDDIEQLREHLGIERWLVFGGSWGSTLALAYAQAHPERCLGLVLRGIWLGTQAEIDWWLYGIRHFFPREWEAFASHLPPEERHDLLAGYRRRLQHPDPAVHRPAAQAWSRYEGACLTLRPDPATVEAFTEDRVALGLSRLEAHYFAHHAFLAPDQLLAGMPSIAHLPACIVHGRYDVICPVQQAFALADAWPGARLQVVTEAGHSSMEPGIAAALVAATDRFAAQGTF
ncbi:prolyl aminopeptidase [Ideonella livida]|uniref:Proline iminopeptidase n=1 Tax=Ideonella livida TaxID=2707176 RepID=A0A7C9PET8_9BURK|nr:prolyl aminopeptidase [Ideonella livida]NDY90116.1 prolyl aminopeptidase [Ideonella livida]